MKTPRHRRMFFDIETCPNLCYVWRVGRELDIGTHLIKEERRIICIAWKWEGERKIHSLHWDKRQSDESMLRRFVRELEKADEVVAHNGDRFDIRWVRGRCFLYDIPLTPNIVSQDTLKLLRRYFELNSYAKDYVSRFKGFGKKQDVDWPVWEAIMDGDEAMLRKMVRYCRHDVRLLEMLWRAINPYVPAKSNFAHFHNHCPECGSDNVVINKHRITAAGAHRITFRCKDCGKYHTLPASKFDKGKEV